MLPAVCKQQTFSQDWNGLGLTPPVYSRPRLEHEALPVSVCGSGVCSKTQHASRPSKTDEQSVEQQGEGQREERCTYMDKPIPKLRLHVCCPTPEPQQGIECLRQGTKYFDESLPPAQSVRLKNCHFLDSYLKASSCLQCPAACSRFREICARLGDWGQSASTGSSTLPEQWPRYC